MENRESLRLFISMLNVRLPLGPRFFVKKINVLDENFSDLREFLAAMKHAPTCDLGVPP